MCWGCAAHHIGRHSYDVEHQCDECGAISEWMHPLGGTATVTVLTRSTHGDAALYTGTVIAIALGICPSCARRRGVTA